MPNSTEVNITKATLRQAKTDIEKAEKHYDELLLKYAIQSCPFKVGDHVTRIIKTFNNSNDWVDKELNLIVTSIRPASADFELPSDWVLEAKTIDLDDTLMSNPDSQYIYTQNEHMECEHQILTIKKQGSLNG